MVDYHEDVKLPTNIMNYDRNNIFEFLHKDSIIDASSGYILQDNERKRIFENKADILLNMLYINESDPIFSFNTQSSNLLNNQVLSLFIAFYKNKYSINDIIDYLVLFNDIGYDKLIVEDLIFFANSIDIVQSTISYLDILKELGFDVSEDKCIDVNNGIFNTPSYKFENIVNKYSSLLNINQLLIYKHSNNKLYKIVKTNSSKNPIEAIEIPDNCTFVLHNPTTENEIMYITQVLAGTNSTLVISNFGHEIKCNDNIEFINDVLNQYELQSCVSNRKNGIIYPFDDSVDNNDYVYDVIVIDAKKIKQIESPLKFINSKNKKIIDLACRYNIFANALQVENSSTSLNSKYVNYSNSNNYRYGSIGGIENHLLKSPITSDKKVRIITRYLKNIGSGRYRLNAHSNVPNPRLANNLNIQDTFDENCSPKTSTYFSPRSVYHIGEVSVDLRTRVKDFINILDINNDDLENFLLEYVLNNTANLLLEYAKLNGQTLNILIDDDVNTALNIKINKSNLLHLFGFISYSDFRELFTGSNQQLQTRFYAAVKEEMNNNNNDYFDSIIYVLKNFPQEIKNSICSTDSNYSKMDLWNKIAIKTSNMSWLLNELKYANLEVYRGSEVRTTTGSNPKEAYLLLFTIENETGKIGLVIERSNQRDPFYLKSSVFITNYDELNNLENYDFSYRTSNRFNGLIGNGYISGSNNTFNLDNNSLTNLFDYYKDKYIEQEDFEELNSIVTKIRGNIETKIKNRILSLIYHGNKFPNLLKKYITLNIFQTNNLNQYYELLSKMVFNDNDIDALTILSNSFERFSTNDYINIEPRPISNMDNIKLDIVHFNELIDFCYSLQDILQIIESTIIDFSCSPKKKTKEILDYCEKYKKWPTFDEDDTYGYSLNLWLYESGFYYDNFKYSDVIYDGGLSCHRVLWEALYKYGTREDLAEAFRIKETSLYFEKEKIDIDDLMQFLEDNNLLKHDDNKKININAFKNLFRTNSRLQEQNIAKYPTFKILKNADIVSEISNIPNKIDVSDLVQILKNKCLLSEVSQENIDIDEVLMFVHELTTYCTIHADYSNLIRSYLINYDNISEYALEQIIDDYRNQKNNIYYMLVEVGFLIQSNLKKAPVLNYYSFEELEKMYQETHSIDSEYIELCDSLANDLYNSLDEIVNSDNSDNSDNVKQALKQLILELAGKASKYNVFCENDDVLNNYIIYKTQLFTLQLIVTNLENEKLKIANFEAIATNNKIATAIKIIQSNSNLLIRDSSIGIDSLDIKIKI